MNYAINKDGLTSMQRWRIKNRDKMLAKMKEYRLKNKEEIRRKKREYYEKNKDKIDEYLLKNKERRLEYRRKNKEQKNKYLREYSKNPTEKHKDSIRHKTRSKYGKLPLGFVYHHTTEPYEIDAWIGVGVKDHYKFHSYIRWSTHELCDR